MSTITARRWTRRLSAIACFMVGSVTLSQAQTAKQYVAVIDAGSSGTRLSFYSVIPGPYPQISEPPLIDSRSQEVQPNGKPEDGINNFVCQGQEGYKPPSVVVQEVINPLLQELSNRIAEPDLRLSPSQVTVNLFATAGMRVAEQKCGKVAVTALYALIRLGIAAKGFTPGQVRTIDGNSEEGIWTWGNLNDRRGVFTSNTPPVGVIELGGSSLQISYPTAQTPDPAKNLYSVTINNKKFTVFNRTYLGLGQDDARKHIRTQPLDYACWPTGFDRTWDRGEEDDPAGKIKANGNYSALTCGGYYANYIKSKLVDPNVAASSGKFVGIDGVYHALDFWNIEQSPSKLTENLAHCGSLDGFTEIHKNKHSQRQCANATYVNELLFGSSVGLFRGRPAEIVEAIPNKEPNPNDPASEKIEITKLTWTRGFILLNYSTAAGSTNPVNQLWLAPFMARPQF